MSDYKIIPADIDQVTQVFPAIVVDRFMIPYNEIPEEYRRGRTKGNQFFNDMFFSGVKNIKIVPREGIDPEKAWTHIKTVSHSFEPRHGHKEAFVAFVLDHWFSDLQWERNDK